MCRSFWSSWRIRMLLLRSLSGMCCACEMLACDQNRVMCGCYFYFSSCLASFAFLLSPLSTLPPPPRVLRASDCDATVIFTCCGLWFPQFDGIFHMLLSPQSSSSASLPGTARVLGLTAWWHISHCCWGNFIFNLVPTETKQRTPTPSTSSWRKGSLRGASV